MVFALVNFVPNSGTTSEFSTSPPFNIPWGVHASYVGLPKDLSCSRGKKCTMLCGAVHGVTPDPVNSSRPSIRWGYDPEHYTTSSPEGAYCYYCSYTFMSRIAYTLEVRDKKVYITDVLQKDDVALKNFLELRRNVIEKAKRKGESNRRSGGAGVQSSQGGGGKGPSFLGGLILV